MTKETNKAVINSKRFYMVKGNPRRKMRLELDHLYAMYGEQGINQFIKRHWGHEFKGTIGSRPFNEYRVLSVDKDPKTSKGADYGYLTAINYLAPFNMSAITNMCGSGAVLAGCPNDCLVFSGNGGMFPTVNMGRIRKTLLLVCDPELWAAYVAQDLALLNFQAMAQGLKPCVRFDGTSDRNWMNVRHDGQPIPKIAYDMGIQPYDYTKDLDKPSVYPEWYHLTMSHSTAQPYESMLIDKMIEHPMLNIAFVYQGAMPSTFIGRMVIDGDKHDLRFLDPQGVAVALKGKGLLKGKESKGLLIASR